MLKIQTITLLIPLSVIGLTLPVRGQDVGDVPPIGKAALDGQGQGHGQIINDGVVHGYASGQPAAAPVPWDQQEEFAKGLEFRLQQLATMLGCSDQEFAQLRPSLLAMVDYDTRAHNLLILRDADLATVGGRTYLAKVSPADRALLDLHNAVIDPNSSPNLIVARLAALRAIRAQKLEAVTAVRNNLKPRLSVRQEAVRVLNKLLP